MNTYRIPARFYLDHLARDCGKSGKILKNSKSYSKSNIQLIDKG